MDHPSKPQAPRAKRVRDSQRSAVYAWESATAGTLITQPEFESLEQCRAWLLPVWRAERARYGRAGVREPEILRPAWGQRRGLAFTGRHVITLPRWTRSRWYCLHELAHLLAMEPEAHGPRFVGILMGLLARHAGWDVDELMASADAAGVKYHVRSIGAVPIKSLSEKICAALDKEGPMAPMELATWIDVRYFSVWAAVMGLVRRGHAVLRRGRLHLLPTESEGAACDTSLAVA